jgi:hypothetical protein
LTSAAAGWDLARIVVRAKDPLDDAIEIERFGPTDFNGAVHGSPRRNPRNRTCDIVGGYRLDEHWWQTNGITVSGSVGDALQELEELSRLDDRVRNRRLLDQLFLRQFCAEAAIAQQTFGADHR